MYNLKKNHMLLCFHSGKMQEIEHVIFTKWFEWILSSQNIHADLIGKLISLFFI